MFVKYGFTLDCPILVDYSETMCVLKKHLIYGNVETKIAYHVLRQQIEDGELKLADFESNVKSLKIMWINVIQRG